MNSKNLFPSLSVIAHTAAALLAAATFTLANAAPRALPDGMISGVVKSTKGPEAGVWVIAETDDLQTHFIKTVVTDDAGRFVLPQLPNATYNLWVRGYGLVDSDKAKGRPGDTGVELTAKIAPTPADAAKVYPGNYWLSLLQPPAKSEFPGTGASGNGIPPALKEQGQWINNIKSQCNFCHELGTAITRSLGHMDHLGFKTPEEAWIYRTQLGVRGSYMAGQFAVFGTQAGAKVFADWTNRIASGELPPQPPRPQGVERNVVVTLWDWGTDNSFMHDEVSTDKNDPTVNAYGPVYAASAGHGKISAVDPVENKTYEITIPTRDDPRKVSSRFPPAAMPSNFWGMRHLWGVENPADPHNPMMDRKGRVWATSKIRENEPDWCKEGSKNKFAQYYPLTFSARQASFYDPKTGEFKLIDTCFGTHHLQFDTDADQTLYFNELVGPMVGWLNVREYDRTGDEQASQGWCPQIVDTNGDGKITKPWNKPGEPVDPKRDTEVKHNLYSIVPSPVDNSAWGASEDYPGYIVRVDRGANPPETCITEVYKVPAPGIDPRGIDIDTNGVVWTALAASSHLASFDRRKCKVTKGGPNTLDGTQCPEGWTLYLSDGPRFKGTDIPSDFHYYNWVDQQDVAGFGKNTPLATGSNSEAILVLDTKTKQWVKLRVPYPLGFYHRGMDGRIDDPAAGWKGRGLWANYGTHLIWHIEGGKGSLGKVVHFQIRPDPLAY
jgi:hypothetical protein